MAVQNGFDLHELDEFTRDLVDLAQKQFPKEAKQFIQKQGNEGRKRLRANTRAVTKKRTGNLLRGIQQGKATKYKGNYQIRIMNTAPHAHLIEYGHSNIKTRAGSGSQGKIPKGSPVQMVPGNGSPVFIEGTREKWIPGKHPLDKTAGEMGKEFPRAAEAFVDELLRKGLG